MQAKWRVYERTSKNLLDHLCELRGLDPALLIPDFAAHLHDPNLLPDMKQARALLKQAVKEKQKVTIFGDYDADGTPAAALLSLMLDRLGVENQVILPTRTSGYGLRAEFVQQAVDFGSQLLITVDTGIASIDEIKLAKKAGLKVIILDHHLPKKVLPPADALIDPYVPNSTYPFNFLCGCALAYKLMEAAAADFPELLSEGFRKWLLDIVAISTVSDMMMMVGENRVLVHYGLQVLKKTKRPGLQALMKVAAIDPAKLSGQSLGYVLGPRLNASGRLGDNRLAYELLKTDNLAEAQRIAQEIERNNRDRQQLVSDVLAEAEKLLFKQNQKNDHLYIVAGNGWPAGVIGLVAGKISSTHTRPVIVLADHSGKLTGSARSLEAYSMIDGLDASQQFLTRYGGHRTAAGLSLTRDQLPKFVDSIKAHAKEHVSAEDLVPTYLADALLEMNELNLETAALCEQLSPFGLQNPHPLFVIPDIELGTPKKLGATGSHLKWRAKKNDLELDIIGFGMDRQFQNLPVTRAHVLGHVEANHWNNQTRLQIRLVDYKDASEAIPTTPFKKKLAGSE